METQRTKTKVDKPWQIGRILIIDLKHVREVSDWMSSGNLFHKLC